MLGRADGVRLDEVTCSARHAAAVLARVVAWLSVARRGVAWRGVSWRGVPWRGEVRRGVA